MTYLYGGYDREDYPRQSDWTDSGVFPKPSEVARITKNYQYVFSQIPNFGKLGICGTPYHGKITANEDLNTSSINGKLYLPNGKVIPWYNVSFHDDCANNTWMSGSNYVVKLPYATKRIRSVAQQKVDEFEGWTWPDYLLLTTAHKNYGCYRVKNNIDEWEYAPQYLSWNSWLYVDGINVWVIDVSYQMVAFDVCRVTLWLINRFGVLSDDPAFYMQAPRILDQKEFTIKGTNGTPVLAWGRNLPGGAITNREIQKFNFSSDTQGFTFTTTGSGLQFTEGIWEGVEPRYEGSLKNQVFGAKNLSGTMKWSKTFSFSTLLNLNSNLEVIAIRSPKLRSTVFRCQGVTLNTLGLVMIQYGNNSPKVLINSRTRVQPESTYVTNYGTNIENLSWNIDIAVTITIENTWQTNNEDITLLTNYFDDLEFDVITRIKDDGVPTEEEAFLSVLASSRFSRAAWLEYPYNNMDYCNVGIRADSSSTGSKAVINVFLDAVCGPHTLSYAIVSGYGHVWPLAEAQPGYSYTYFQTCAFISQTKKLFDRTNGWCGGFEVTLSGIGSTKERRVGQGIQGTLTFLGDITALETYSFSEDDGGCGYLLPQDTDHLPPVEEYPPAEFCGSYCHSYQYLGNERTCWSGGTLWDPLEFADNCEETHKAMFSGTYSNDRNWNYNRWIPISGFASLADDARIGNPSRTFTYIRNISYTAYEGWEIDEDGNIMLGDCNTLEYSYTDAFSGGSGFGSCSMNCNWTTSRKFSNLWSGAPTITESHSATTSYTRIYPNTVIGPSFSSTVPDAGTGTGSDFKKLTNNLYYLNGKVHSRDGRISVPPGGWDPNDEKCFVSYHPISHEFAYYTAPESDTGYINKRSGVNFV